MFYDKLKLRQEFYLRDTVEVARDLIGKIFVKRIDDGIKSHIRTSRNKLQPANEELKNDCYMSAIIVETEAYLHRSDAASHSYPGMTERNKPMFACGGILYVYKSYGIHHCVNIVTEAEGIGAAVLIRAAEPIAGIKFMSKNRGTDDVYRLCCGPGNFGKAFDIGLEFNNESLTGDKIFIIKGLGGTAIEIGNSRRIGITRSKDLLLRFFLKNSSFVSKNSKVYE